MRKELISVIIPIYNSERYLEACLKSVIEQTYKNIEIILVDDGSTDDSPHICDDYAKKDSRIKVIHKENAGVSVARNIGIENAKGEYITFVDSDDWIENRYCEILYNHIDEKTDFVIGRTIAFDEFGNPKDDGYNGEKENIFDTKKEKEKLFESIFIDNLKIIKYPHISTCSAKLIRKSIIINNKIKYNKNLIFYEDALFNMEVIILSQCVKVINQKMYFYRLHSLSATKRFNNNLVEEYNKVYDSINKFSRKYDLDFDEYMEYFKIKNLNTILLNYCNDKQKKKNKISFIKDICSYNVYIRAINKIDIRMLPKRRKLLVVFARFRLYGIIYLFYNF